MRPSIVDQFRNAVIESNRLKAVAEKLKPEIKTLLEETGGWDDCYFLTKEIVTWHEDVLYDWLCEEYPDLAPSLSKKTVDLEKLGEAVKLGLIKEIPNHVSSTIERKEVHTKMRKKVD